LAESSTSLYSVIIAPASLATRQFDTGFPPKALRRSCNQADRSALLHLKLSTRRRPDRGLCPRRAGRSASLRRHRELRDHAAEKTSRD
jgi:hypothetical protein